MKTSLALSCALLLGGCASTPHAPANGIISFPFGPATIGGTPTMLLVATPGMAGFGVPVAAIPYQPGQSFRYTGFMGAGTGDVTLTRLSAARFEVTITEATPTGIGYVNGPARLRYDGAIEMTHGVRDDGARAACDIILQPHNAAKAGLNVIDRGCRGFQQPGVVFQGKVRRLSGHSDFQ